MRGCPAYPSSTCSRLSPRLDFKLCRQPDLLLPFGLHRFVYFDPRASRAAVDSFLLSADTLRSEATLELKNPSLQEVTGLKKAFPNLGLEGGVQGLDVVCVYFGLGRYLSTLAEFALLMRLTKKHVLKVTVGAKAASQHTAEQFMIVLQKLLEMSG